MQAAEVGDRTASGIDDATVFAELYPGLRRFAAAVGPAEVDPDDLVQEAVARTLRQRRLTDLDDAGAYLRRTIANLASNHRRSLARWRTAMARLAPATPPPTEYASDLADLLRLDPSVRAVLYLVEVEGRSYRDAGDLLGVSEDAARTRAARGRRQLRTGIEGEL